MTEQHQNGRLTRPYRLTRFISTTVHQLESNGEWKELSTQPSVVEQFNTWTVTNSMTLAPSTSPVITMSQAVSHDATGDTYVHTTEVLTAAVVTLQDEFDIDVERRVAMQRLLHPDVSYEALPAAPAIPAVAPPSSPSSGVAHKAGTNATQKFVRLPAAKSE